MKIVIAPDKFKGTLSASEAAEAIARGVRRALGSDVEIDTCPVADGGEGTVEALVAATEGELHRAKVTGPLGEPVDAVWGMLGDGRTAVIEMAAAAGLWLIPEEQRDPTKTTTYGVGELMRAAMDAGASWLVVGIGGSATTDGGTGMAQALGIGFEGAPTPMTGGALQQITAVDFDGLDSRLLAAGGEVEVRVACDVTNPLTGPNGAATVYGPQKGATEQQVAELEAGLKHLATLVDDVDSDRPGMGAAGGLGFGLAAFAGAVIERGIDLVLDAVGFRRRIAGADLVITGEGKLDGQSVQGKTCVGVAQAAGKAGIETVALAGMIGDGAEKAREAGLAEYHAIVDGEVTVEQAMRDPAPLLERLAERIIRQHAGV